MLFHPRFGLVGVGSRFCPHREEDCVPVLHAWNRVQAPISTASQLRAADAFGGVCAVVVAAGERPVTRRPGRARDHSVVWR